MGYISRLLSGQSRLGNEFLGTLCFVLVGTSALTAINITGQATTAMTFLVGLCAFSLTLGWLMYLMGSQSLPHLNPAVTLLQWLRNQVSFSFMLSAVFWQLFGAIVASVIVALLYGSNGVEVRLGAPYPFSSMGVWAAFMAETFGSIVFLGGSALAYLQLGKSRIQAAAIIGISYGIGYMLSVGVSGGALNPARALAPQLTAADLTGWWVYIFGPITAAALAIWIGRPATNVAKSVLSGHKTTESPHLPSSSAPHEPQDEDTEVDLQQKAQQAIEKLRQSHPQSRALPSSIPSPSFYDEPTEKSSSSDQNSSSQAQDSHAESRPDPVSTTASKKPAVKFVQFEAEDEPEEDQG